MKAIWEVMGIKKTKSTKTGKDCFTYAFAGDYTDYEQENGECEGRTVMQEFCYTEFPVSVGDMVELDYEKGFQDKAQLCGINVVKPATPFKDKSKEQK